MVHRGDGRSHSSMLFLGTNHGHIKVHGSHVPMGPACAEELA